MFRSLLSNGRENDAVLLLVVALTQRIPAIVWRIPLQRTDDSAENLRDQVENDSGLMCRTQALQSLLVGIADQI